MNIGVLLDIEEFDKVLDKKNAAFIDNEIRRIKELDTAVFENIQYSKGTPQVGGSLVLRHFTEVLNSISDKELNLQQKEKKEVALDLIGKIEKVRIVDPRVLMKIYYLHKYKQPKIQDFINTN